MHEHSTNAQLQLDLEPTSTVSSAVRPTTLADVLVSVERAVTLSPIRRRDLCSAVRRIADLIGRPVERLPARLAELNPLVNAIHPAQAGLSGKTLQNLRANLIAAIRLSGTNQSNAALVDALPLAWKAMHRSLASKRLKNGLSRFIRYCGQHSIAPETVGDDTVAAFMDHVREDTLVAKPNEVHRQTTRLWNEAASTVDGWPQTRLTVPDFRKPRVSMPLSAFLPSFQADVQAHLVWMAGTDPFCANPPPKACKPRTIDQRRRQIGLAASRFVERGHDLAELRMLADLVTVESVKTILRAYLERNDGRTTQFLRDLAKALILIARYWVRVDADQLAALKDLKRRLGADAVGLTEKNRTALRQFDDERNLAHLYTLPSDLIAEAMKAPDDNAHAAVTMQIAIALEILFMAPIRMENLIAVRLDQHLVRPGGRRGLFHLVFMEVEVKNAEPIDFELPRHLTDWINLYLERFRPCLCDAEVPWLFVNQFGAQKAQTTLAQQIKEIVFKRTGLHITPHQFRHLAAKVLLTAEPGNFETARRVLGHTNMKTTTNFYAGLQTGAAAKHFDATVLKERERLARIPTKGRTR